MRATRAGAVAGMIKTIRGCQASPAKAAARRHALEQEH